MAGNAPLEEEISPYAGCSQEVEEHYTVSKKKEASIFPMEGREVRKHYLGGLKGSY